MSGRKGPTVRRKELPTYIVHNTDSSNSVRIRQGRHSYRVLVDTGVEVAVIHKRVYSVLKAKPEILRERYI